MTPNSGDGVNYTRAEGGEDGVAVKPGTLCPKGGYCDLPGGIPCLGGCKRTDGVQASCEWQEEDPDFMPGTYRSACGELWAFTDGGVKENHVRFCQGCGKPVHVVERPAEPEDADGVPGTEGQQR